MYLDRSWCSIEALLAGGQPAPESAAPTSAIVGLEVQVNQRMAPTEWHLFAHLNEGRPVELCYLVGSTRGAQEVALLGMLVDRQHARFEFANAEAGEADKDNHRIEPLPVKRNGKVPVQTIPWPAADRRS